MENVKWTIVRVVIGNKWNQADTLEPKGAEVVAKSVCAAQQMDNIPPGLKIAPKARTIIYYVKRGKPYMLLVCKVLTPQGEETA